MMSNELKQTGKELFSCVTRPDGIYSNYSTYSTYNTNLFLIACSFKFLESMLEMHQAKLLKGAS